MVPSGPSLSEFFRSRPHHPARRWPGPFWMIHSGSIPSSSCPDIGIPFRLSATPSDPSPSAVSWPGSASRQPSGSPSMVTAGTRRGHCRQPDARGSVQRKRLALDGYRVPTRPCPFSRFLRTVRMESRVVIRNSPITWTRGQIHHPVPPSPAPRPWRHRSPPGGAADRHEWHMSAINEVSKAIALKFPLTPGAFPITDACMDRPRTRSPPIAHASTGMPHAAT